MDIEQRVAAAEAAMAARDWDTAITLWADIRAAAPDIQPAWDRAALALRNAQRFDDSDDLVRASSRRFGLKPGHLLTMGDTAMDARDWPTAIGRWAELRARFPKIKQGYYRAAQAHLAMAQPEVSEALLTEGLARLPDSREILLLHAEAAMTRRDWEEALRRWELLRVHHPQEPKGYLRAADALGEAGHVTGAEQILAHYIDNLLRDNRAPPLQSIIDEIGAIHATGVSVSRHAGSLALFERARTDERLASLLRGEIHKPPPRKPGTPLRVVFYFPTVIQTDNLMPLYEAMCADNRFEPMILCSRNNSSVLMDSFSFYNEKYPADQGYCVVDGGPHISSNLSIYDLQPDVVFYHTPYSLSGDYPFYLRADFVARHAWIGHVNYGYFLLTLGASNDHIYTGEHVRSCDFIFAESTPSVETYALTLPAERIHKTGYTKLDEFRRHLVKVPFREICSRSSRLDVIWTPHWQTREDPTGGTHTSNFLPYFPAMLELAARPDIHLHVRPHPLLRSRLNTVGLLPISEYDVIMDRFRAAGATVYPANEGAPYVPALMNAAVLISDFSSLVPEFLITGRPLIFCRTEDVWNNGKWIGPFGKSLIENCCYIADDVPSIREHLDQILVRHQHPKEAAIEAFAAENGLYPEGSSSERILNVLTSRLRPASMD